MVMRPKGFETLLLSAGLGRKPLASVIWKDIANYKSSERMVLDAIDRYIAYDTVVVESRSTHGSELGLSIIASVSSSIRKSIFENIKYYSSKAIVESCILDLPANTSRAKDS